MAFFFCSTFFTGYIMKLNYILEVCKMKKVIGAIIGAYFGLTIGVVVWMFGFPKSYGKFMSKWEEKVTEGIED